jgi:hypothetical protein
MTEHELKILPEYFQAVESGYKTFEIRENDRGFAVGDVLWLREFNKGVGLTGRSVHRRVTYVTDYMQLSGYVVLGLSTEPGVDGCLFCHRQPPPPHVTTDDLRHSVCADCLGRFNAVMNPELERKYRTLLWLGHGHDGLYGDDGEMQCGKCRPFDYKRAPLADVEAAAERARMEAVKAALNEK